MANANSNVIYLSRLILTETSVVSHYLTDGDKCFLITGKSDCMASGSVKATCKFFGKMTH